MSKIRDLWYGPKTGGKTPKQLFHDACRRAAQPSTVAFRVHFFDKHKKPYCAVTGADLTWFNSDVDHAPPWAFRHIANSFFDKTCLEVFAAEPNHAALADRDTAYTSITKLLINDHSVQNSFLRWHDDRAILRLVSSEWNRSADGKYSGHSKEYPGEAEFMARVSRMRKQWARAEEPEDGYLLYDWPDGR